MHLQTKAVVKGKSNSEGRASDNHELVNQSSDFFENNAQILSWKDLPFKTKRKITDPWTAMLVASNIFHLTGLTFEFVRSDEAEIYQDLLVGLGTFFLYFSLVKYLRYSSTYNSLISTLIRSGTAVISSFAALIPIFIGVAIYCMTQFGASYRFGSLDLSVMMLWALLLGDEL